MRMAIIIVMNTVVVIDQCLTFLKREPGFRKNTVECWMTVPSFAGAKKSFEIWVYEHC